MGGLTLHVRASLATFDGKPGYDGADSTEQGNAWAPDPLPGTWPDLHTWYRCVVLMQRYCWSTSNMRRTACMLAALKDVKNAHPSPISPAHLPAGPCRPPSTAIPVAAGSYIP